MVLTRCWCCGPQVLEKSSRVWEMEIAIEGKRSAMITPKQDSNKRASERGSFGE